MSEICKIILPWSSMIWIRVPSFLLESCNSQHPQEALVWWNAWRSQQYPLWRLFLCKIFLAQARNICRIWLGRSHAWSCFTLLCRASHWKWCQECMNSNRKKLQIFLGRWRPWKCHWGPISFRATSNSWLCKVEMWLLASWILSKIPAVSMFHILFWWMFKNSQDITFFTTRFLRTGETPEKFSIILHGNPMAPDLSSVSPKARSWIYGGAGISWMGRSRSTDTWKDKGWRDPQ